MRKLFIAFFPTILGIGAIAAFHSSPQARNQLTGWLRSAGFEVGQPEPTHQSGCRIKRSRADNNCTNGYLVSLFDQRTACVSYDASGLTDPSKVQWDKSLRAYGIRGKKARHFLPAWLYPEPLGGADRWNNLFPLTRKAWRKWNRDATRVIDKACQGQLSLAKAREVLKKRWSRV